MKRSGKRLLAVLLCFAMALTLLPMAAFARWDEELPAVPAEAEMAEAEKAELPAEAPEGNEPAMLATGEADGALEDSWAQDAQTIRGTGALCLIENGKLVLKVAGENSNNGDEWTGATTGTGPAVFTSSAMSNALTADNGVYTVSFKMTPKVAGMCFGVYFNYKDPHHGALVGFNTPGGWFWQTYNGGGNAYSQTTLPGPSELAVGTTYQIEASWNPTAKTATLKVDGTSVVENWDYAAVPDTQDVGIINNLGIKLGKSDTNTLSEIEVWDIHYTGQADTTTVKTVSGAVTSGSEGVNEAAVTLEKKTGEVVNARYTDTTGTDGAYSIANVVPGTYTVTVTKEGYNTVTDTVTVDAVDVTKNVTLTVKQMYTLPTDGVTNDTWALDSATQQSTGDAPICAKTNQGLHLKAGTAGSNGHTEDSSQWPAVFVNETASAALFGTGSGAGAKYLELTFTSALAADKTRFGVYLYYTNPAKGFFVGYDNLGWFWEEYGGTGATYYGGNRVGGPAANTPTTLRLEWTGTSLTKATVRAEGAAESEGTNLFPNMPKAFGTGSNTTGTQLGIKCAPWESDSITEVYIKEMHYTGQTTVTAYPVSGVVKDASNTAIAGATVSAGAGYTATTEANGAYRLVLPENGTYTLTASKAGYSTVTESLPSLTAAATKDITLVKLPEVTGTVTDSSTPAKAIAGATVTLTKGSGDNAVTQTASTDANGAYTFIGVSAGTYTLTVNAVGYAEATKSVTVASTDVTVEAITLTEDLSVYHVLEAAGMDVLADKTFPRVVQYRLKNDLGMMDGQKEEINTIKINGTAATLGTITSELSADKKTVTYTIPMTAPVDATMTARLTVDTSKDDMKPNVKNSASEGRTLGFFIDEVTYTNNDRLTNPVKSIEIPDHSLVSVNSTQTDAKVTLAQANNNSRTTHDTTYLAAGNNLGRNEEIQAFVAFVSNNTFSAGIATNSSLGHNDGTTDKADFTKVSFAAQGDDDVTMSLASVAWPYDYLLADSNPGDVDHTIDLTAAQKVIDPDLREQPYVKVVIAPELNNDGKVDWQDGAIALRETVMHIPNNSETVKDRVNTRIALNFGSQAQNPFLTSLDNARRVAAHTDGLGQAILLKGYANEGHDSGHPDYWDMGERMGGPTDFETMLKEGKKVGAYFGIHVNAGEMYAEAEAVDDKMIYYREDGRVKWGWNWHDSAISFKSIYDFGSGLRRQRFQRLFDEGGADLEFIYVDIWGNWTGGTDDSWQTRMLTRDITEMVGDGHWRIAHEWSGMNPVNSTLQHWVSDYTYGNYTHKGILNSAVIRFMLNQYKDSFPPDFATFGGANNAPLLGGPAMQGFEGWQKDGEYDLSIYNTFNQMVPTKFLQHFGITNWINATNSVDLPYSDGANGAHTMSQTSAWTPEMQVKLAGKIRETDTEAAKIVVTRGLDENLDTTAVFNTLDDEATYRSRVMTLNGKVILKGAPASAGEDTAFPASKATLEYLIPWYWTADGKAVDAADEKLYYWNGNQGATGSTQWTLPDGWENLSSVILYKLSDQGRDAGTTVTVTGGKVTFSDIEAETPYVVVKGETGAAAPVIEYTAKGQHLVDPSFNDAKLSAWTISGGGKAKKVDSVKGISVMQQTGAVETSQVLTEMKPNTKYVAYVAVENRSDAKAYIKVTDASGKVLGSNYTTRSIARNYIGGDSLNNTHGVETGGSFMQNMYAFFTTPASGSVTLTLGREAGDGNVYFDATRVVESQMAGYTYDKDGNITGLTQDFEHAVQGEWPFVVAGVQGVQDNCQHLAEKHAPYTQSGWNVKEVDDVLDGHWSLKTHNLSGNGNLVYQTIPQNFRFEPGKTYTITFDYQMGCENLMQVVIGDGAWDGIGSCQTIPLEMAKGAGFEGYPASNIAAGTGTKTCTFTVVGSESGQTWIGIATAGGTYNKTGMPDQDDGALNYCGRSDFILDNLKIAVSSVDKSELSAAVTAAAAMEAASYTKADSYSGTEEAAWSTFETARDAAQTVLDNPKASQSQVNSAKTALDNAIKNLKKVEVVISGTVTGVNNAPVAGAVVTLENAEYRPVGITATTDAEGKFTFTSTEDVTLNVADYELRVQATGYQVNTFPVTGLTKAAPTKEVEACALEAEAPGAYVNDFNSGDFSMMGALTTGDDIPTWTIENYKGSPALKVTFNATSGETRSINNVVDKTEAAKIKNGTVSFDITGLTNTIRLGITLRATGPNDRIFVGQEDAEKKWFWEWWKTGVAGDHYDPASIKDIGIHPGETRRVRVELNEANVKVFIDGVQIYNSTMTGAPDQPGYVGINMRNNAGTSYILDNLRIVSNDAVEDGKYTVEGSVTATGAALAGAAVAVYSGTTLVTSTTTNAAGLYKTQPLDPDTYTIRVTAPNYTTAEETGVEITNANIQNKNFTMSVDKTALNTLYTANKDTAISGADRNDYTQESFKALTDALAAAKAVLDDENATADQIGAARMDLEDAVSGLTEAATDYSALRELYDNCKDLLAKDYTSETFTPFETARAAAYDLLFGDEVLQTAVDAAKTDLEDKLAALVIIPADNKDALNAAIEAAEAVTNAGYTDESWNTFQEKLTEAKTIAEDETGAYTQTQVDKAAKALTDAQAALAKKPSGGGSSGGGSSAPAETTKTEVKEDGTKVTTVTKPDGTKVETTEEPDGTKAVVETKPDGSKNQTVEQADGTKSEMNVTKDGDVTITVTDAEGEELVKTEIPAEIPEPETKFEDVAETAPWAEEAINKVAGLELVKGTGNNNYSPVAPMTRGSLATVLHRLSQGKTNYEATFKDVAKGKYYTEGVAWAAKANVVKGISEDIFAPERIITREQLAVMLARYAKLVGLNTKADGKALEQFVDGEKTGTWAVDGMAWCVENGILKGKSGNTLDPNADVTRAEVAVMLDRFIALLK